MKKFLGLVTFLVAAMTTAVMFAVSASAVEWLNYGSFNDMDTLSMGYASTVDVDLRIGKEMLNATVEDLYAKVNVKKDSIVQFRYDSTISDFYIVLYNKNGVSVKDFDGYSASKGSLKKNTSFVSDVETKATALHATWKKSAKSAKGYVNYRLAAGDYYIRISCNAKGRITITPSVTSASVPETSSIQLVLKLGVGKSISIDNTVSPVGAAKVSYSSSDSSIASVTSKGLIQGISKGTAMIRLKSGRVTLEITVKVS